MQDFPREPDEITPEWLSQVLGADVTGVAHEQIGIGVGILGRLFRVTLTGEGVPPSVIVKLPTLDEGARMNVVAPLRFYEKEVRFYEQAAAGSPTATPQTYFSGFDPDSGDFCLVLEDLGDRRMADQTVGCTPEDAAVAVDNLVDLHAHWWQSPRLDEMSWLYRGADPPFPQVIAGMAKQAWPRFLEGFGDRTPAHMIEVGERFDELLPWMLSELSNDPVTLLHGDYRLDNLFFASADGHPPVACVDWQIAIKGRAAYDLGYFISQSLTTEDRREHEQGLVRAYHEGLAARGVDYPFDDLWRDYRITTLFCFVYPVNSAGQIELANDRARALVGDMLDRSVAAIDDTDALSLAP